MMMQDFGTTVLVSTPSYALYLAEQGIEAGVDFAVLGEEETCTGDSARRLGEDLDRYAVGAAVLGEGVGRAHRQLLLARGRELRPVARDWRVVVEQSVGREDVDRCRRHAFARGEAKRHRVAFPWSAVMARLPAPDVDDALAFEEYRRGAAASVAKDLLSQRIRDRFEARVVLAVKLDFFAMHVCKADVAHESCKGFYKTNSQVREFARRTTCRAVKLFTQAAHRSDESNTS